MEFHQDINYLEIFLKLLNEYHYGLKTAFNLKLVKYSLEEPMTFKKIVLEKIKNYSKRFPDCPRNCLKLPRTCPNHHSIP